MRKNRPADFFAAALLTQPRYADEWVPFGRTPFQVRVTLIVHIVQQSDRFPKVHILTMQLRELLHRIGDGVTMFSQAFRLDPFVEDRESIRSQSCHVLSDRSSVRELPSLSYILRPAFDKAISLRSRSCRVCARFALIVHQIAVCL